MVGPSPVDVTAVSRPGFPTQRSHRRPRSRTGTGVTARLVALVLIPVTVMGSLVGAQVVPRWNTAAQAETIDAEVGHLARVVELHSALECLRFLAAFEVRIGELGMTVPATSELVGVDLQQLTVVTRERAQRALAALGTDTPVDAGDLSRTTEAYATRALSPADAATRYGQLADRVLATGAERARVFEDVARQAGAQNLTLALQSLRLADGVVIKVASPQGIDLSAVWFPAPGAPTQTVASAFGRLASNHATYTTGTLLLRDLGVPTVVAALDRVTADPRVRSFETAVGATINAEPQPVGESAMRAVFSGYVARVTLLDDLVATTTATVSDEARALAAAQRQEFLTWAGVAAGIAIVSVAIAAAAGRSIARPLRGLARYAQAVNQGDLDTRPEGLARRGPRETRVALAVFTDLVANLQLLDRKANALATCAFDDPVLREPLPGRIGDSLASSAAVLSESIGERDRLESNLAHEATHDGLTGVANRAAAVAGIRDAVERSRRTGELTAVLHVDLNDFTAVNDRHGHAAGDEVLRQTAARLVADMRTADLVARLGSDEFAVVTEGVDGIDAAIDLARRIVEMVSRPIDLGGTPVAISATVGIALSDNEGTDDPQRFLANADAAVHRAKALQGSAIEVCDATLLRQMLEREQIEQALTKALASPGGGGLVLHYQPVVATVSGEITGVEALIRWDRPGHGFQQPDDFIPVAEATTLIVDLDRWVLGEALGQLRTWSGDAVLGHLDVAVNISGRHLGSGLLAPHLAMVLEASGVEPHRLTIEITETVLLHDLVSVAAELDAVRRLGVRVALDDFGTGYTSLAHLRHLPVDIVKIDRSFTSQIGSRQGRALVRTVTELGHAVDQWIVAEGVETDDELTAVQELGTDAVQGFLLSRPLAVPALTDWIRNRTTADRRT
jgi:diguanylate cyclase (GGDEF)-like protein